MRNDAFLRARRSMNVNMQPTNAMVRAAVAQAVEAGLLARNAAQNETDWEIIRSIIQAAFFAEQNAVRAVKRKVIAELGPW